MNRYKIAGLPPVTDGYYDGSADGIGVDLTPATPAYTISTTVSETIFLNSAAYAGPLTVTATGVIAPTVAGASGVVTESPNVSLTNDGSIKGALGSTTLSNPVDGGIGVLLDSAGAALLNAGQIAGGNTADATYPAYGGQGVVLSAAGTSLTNTSTGSITGGANTGYLVDYDGLGGVGVDASAGQVTNDGHITGGNGTTNDGQGGVGVALAGAATSLYNGTTGVITGGAAGGGKYFLLVGNGADGVSIRGASGGFDNSGTILGGSGGDGTDVNAGNGGFGLSLGGDFYIPTASVTNSGNITGGAGGNNDGSGGDALNNYGGAGGIGASLLMTGQFLNSGNITGGASGSGPLGTIGGAGVRFVGTLTNTGTISGGAGGAATKAGAAGGRGGTGIYLGGTYGAATVLTTSGTISGGAGGGSNGGAAGPQGYSVLIEGANTQVVVDPGAVFNGAIGIVMEGVGVTFDIANLAPSAVSAAFNDKSYTLNIADGASTLNMHFTTASTDSFAALIEYFTFTSDGSGGTDIRLLSHNAISGLVTDTVNVGDATYNSSITVMATGVIAPTSAGASGVNFQRFYRVTNYGEITGGSGSSGGNGGAGVYLWGGYLTNAGTISGGAAGANGGAMGDAVRFGHYDATLTVDPGAVFNGQVAANAAAKDTLALAGTTAATLTGFGTQFTGFSTLDFAAGSRWTVDATTAAFASQPKIEGFALGDSLDLTNFTASGTTQSFDSSTHVLTLENGASTLALQFDSAFAGEQFVLTPDGSGVDVTLANISPPGTLAKSVTTTVSLGSALYPGPLTVTATGVIAPDDAASTVTRAGVITVAPDVSLINDGSISGPSNFEFGGIGVNLVSVGATLSNAGSIAGGGDLGGIGVRLDADGVQVVNTASGFIAGGDNSNVATAEPVLTAGLGVAIYAGSLSNDGHIAGGSITSGFYGVGGAGALVAAGGTFTNDSTGILTGGAGDDDEGNAGGGGAGVTMSGGTVLNHGSIAGGMGGSSPLTEFKAPLLYSGGVGGAGVNLSGGTLTNAATIKGGTGGRGYIGGSGGAGVYLNGGMLTTSATIAGGAGGAGHVSGVQGAAVKFGLDPATLVVNAGAVFDGAIDSFARGDTIDITGLSPSYVASHFDQTTDVLSLTDGGSSLTLDFTDLPRAAQFSFNTDGNGGTDITTACYRRGTHIMTSRGEVRIESLKRGDRVLTFSGVEQAIHWIGRRSYAACVAADNPEIQPILIRAGALGDGVPKRDLWVSPEHAMYLEGMLIPARALVNGISIVQDDSVAEIRYFHLEFEAHTVIFAEGAASESFVDDESRNMFDNAAEYRRLYTRAGTPRPARFYAPRIEEGAAIEAVRRRLARSGAFTHTNLRGPCSHQYTFRGQLDRRNADERRGIASMAGFLGRRQSKLDRRLGA